jgi:hypothetical protein
MDTEVEKGSRKRDDSKIESSDPGASREELDPDLPMANSKTLGIGRAQKL